MNRDGFADVLVGASGAGPLGGGAAYLYLGGPGAFNTTPDLAWYHVPSALAPSSEFGRAVASAGDVNGDSFDDVVIGARNEGTASVHFGGPLGVMDTSSDGELDGIPFSQEFGTALAAGDFDGDGYGDIAVGSRSFDLPGMNGNNVGAVFIYRGDPGGTFDETADLVIYGESMGDALGASVNSPGDLDGDGYDDLLVGAPQADVGVDDNAGRVYVFHGGPAGLGAMPDATLAGSTLGQRFGSTVQGLSDLNGDGVPDVVVGNGTALASANQVFVYFGGPGWTSAAPLVVTGTTAEHFGLALGCAGDRAPPQSSLRFPCSRRFRIRPKTRRRGSK